MADSAASQLAHFAKSIRLDDIPEAAREQGRRTLLNYFGCACGGAEHEAVEAALRFRREYGGVPAATVIGRAVKVDLLSAPLLNGMSSAVYSFDDTHAEAVVHPGGPVASALLALGERFDISGSDFLAAFIVGTEMVCRLSKAISVNPAKARPEWLQTSVCGGIGAAMACARALGLEERQIVSAMGIAASRASGFRGLSRSMCFSYIAGLAAEAGLQSAILARSGMEGPADPLGGEAGFCAVFSAGSDMAALTAGLGDAYELLRNTYKPYPCGVVIHPIIDACLELPALAAEQVGRVVVEVNPFVLRVADIPEPKDQFEAQMSAQHWTACAVLLRRAGVEQTRPEMLRDPRVVPLRRRVSLVADESLARAQARVRVELAGGGEESRSVRECRGSLDHPLSDAELRAKFDDQAVPRLGADAARLAEGCMAIERVPGMAGLMALAQRSGPGGAG